MGLELNFNVEGPVQGGGSGSALPPWAQQHCSLKPPLANSPRPLQADGQEEDRQGERVPHPDLRVRHPAELVGNPRQSPLSEQGGWD